jgi:uncharacterized protein
MGTASQAWSAPEAPEAASPAVAIMAKAPRAGEVKTRLCPPLSPEEAAALYHCFLLDKVEQVRALPGARPAIAYTPAERRSFFEALAPGFVLLLQRGADLGERLANGFEALFAARHAAVLLIDSDTPTLPTAWLAWACASLAASPADVVLGPSEDGGYYLIGLRKLHRELFADVRWSTPEVLPETLRRARSLGLVVATVPPWFDVDTADDLARLRSTLATVPAGAARHTRRFLEEGRG